MDAADGREGGGGAFQSALAACGTRVLRRGRVQTLQVNVGPHCNMACQHCHVDAGPARTERMGARVADRVLALLDHNPQVQTLDLTGGAPELNPHFRTLVRGSRELGRNVVDRCNLTILLEPGQEDLGEFLAENRAKVVASLPCYGEDNVDRQRGRGAFGRSIEALGRLNRLGYGAPASGLELDLVYNPVGAVLPPSQSDLEERYRTELADRFGLRFNRLLTITNMPIRRFAKLLERTGQLGSYRSLLTSHFNAATVPRLMCRSLVSVDWEGRLFDCDFNQMLALGIGAARGVDARTIWDIDDLDALFFFPVATGDHCFGCTAGSGSSCSGALGVEDTRHEARA